MVFAWQLGRPSPPHTYTHIPPLPKLLLHSSTSDIKGGQGEERGPEALASTFFWGGGAGPHRAALGSPPGPWMTLLPHGALQLAQIWVYLATELALKTHSKAVNLASEASALTDRDVGSLFTFWRGLLIRHPPLIIQAYRGVCL